MIRFAMVVSKVLKNMSDLSFYHPGCPEAQYVDIYYDGTDFIVHNTITNRKVYVAKTNVSQWELDDTDRKEDIEGIPKAIRTKAKS